jgi:hypothetical protein
MSAVVFSSWPPLFLFWDWCSLSEVPRSTTIRDRPRRPQCRRRTELSSVQTSPAMPRKRGPELER